MPAPIDLSFLRAPGAAKRILLAAAACAALAGVAVLVAPSWYRSVLTVVPARQQRGGGLSSLLGGELGGLAAGFEPALGGGADSARIAAVLQSVAVTDAVIDKFALKQRYDEKYQETTRDELWRHCEVKALNKPNLVQLSCEDKDPKFVQQMLEYFADYGNQVFRRVGTSSASEEVRFLEKRVAELRQQADEASARMREFQEKHQIVDLETQTKAVVSAIAALNSQRISKQLELDYARTFSSRDEATTRQLESQLSVMARKLRDLEEPPLVDTAPPEATAVPGKAGREGGRGMFPAALAVPKLRAEFETLYRNRRVSEASLIFALERLESARAAEARDVSTFQVLDPPAMPTRHARPKRLRLALVGLLAGLAIGVAWEWRRSTRATGRAAPGSSPS